MCTAVEETSIESILAVMNTTELVVEIRPVGLLAQLVERCTGITEVVGSNPVWA